MTGLVFTPQGAQVTGRGVSGRLVEEIRGARPLGEGDALSWHL